MRVVPAALCVIQLTTGCLDGTDDSQPFEPDPVAPDAGSFTLQARYDAIRSFPGGGGLFIVAISPDWDFAGTVRLSVTANPRLHTQMSTTLLDTSLRVAEIWISPEAGMETGFYTIQLKAEHGDATELLPLNIEVMEWSQAEPGHEMQMRGHFCDWLAAQHPELGYNEGDSFKRWITYPQHLIVEHWTFFSHDWEMRVCFHVMIPPHDWSMMLLRRRGEMEPVLAARRESNGSIHEIPVNDYPIMYGF